MKVEDLSCPTEVYVLTGSVSVAMVTSSLVQKALFDIFSLRKLVLRKINLQEAY